MGTYKLSSDTTKLKENKLTVCPCKLIKAVKINVIILFNSKDTS